MATERPILIKTIEAAADLSAKQYYFVKMDANGRAAAITGATDVPYGVLQNKPDALGKPAEILRVGISKVSADAAITLGDLIGPSADGQADTKVPGTDTTEYVGGMAEEAAAAAGNIIEASIQCLAPVRAA